MGERSLIAFTLLVQAGSGALVGLLGIQLLGGPDVLGFASFLAVGTILLLAIGTSLLHLGAPRHAFHAAANWRTSWLSREILGLAGLGILVGLGAALALFAPDAAQTAGPRTIVALLAAAVATALVAGMAWVYAIRTIPEWRLAATGASFAGAAMVLGSVVAAVLAVAETIPDRHVGWLPTCWLAGLLTAGLVLERAARRSRGAAGSSRAGGLLVRSGAVRPGDQPMTRLAAGAAMGLVAMALLGAGVAPPAGGLLIVAVVTLASAEVVIREQFYARAPRQGRAASRRPRPADGQPHRA